MRSVEPIASYGSLLYLSAMGKKVATTVYITEKQQDLLKQLNDRTKVPIAEYIRQGIDLVLQRYSEMLPGQMDLPLGQKSSAVEDDENIKTVNSTMSDHIVSSNRPLDL